MKSDAQLGQPMTARKGREENCFDFLRLFAALAVVVTHSYEHLELSVLWLEPGTRLWFFDGVPLFFVLSGFLVYRSCEKCYERGLPVLSFYVNRYLRVAPAIYAYALLTPCVLIAVGALAAPDLLTPQFGAWLLSDLILVPVYYPEMFRHIGVGVLNGSLWTIPVECSFYLVVPLFCLARRRRGIAFTAGVLLVLSLVGQSVVWAFGPNAAATKILNITFLPHLVFFALGIGWSWGWSRAPRHAALGVACLLLYVGFRYELVAPREWLGPLWTFAWGVPLSYTVLWVGYRGPAILRTLTRIGDLSYGVYIWHMVIVNVLLFVGIKTWGWSDPAILGTVVAATLTLALVSWWALERPCLQLKPFTSRDSVSTVAPASEDVRLAPRVVGPVAVDS